MRKEPTAEEKTAYFVIKEMFPNIKFELKDKPDIQALDKSIGIEVVNGTPSKVEKFLHTKEKNTSKESSKAPNPFLDAKQFSCDIIDAFMNQYESKLKKLNAGNYNGYQKYGLVIFSTIPELDLREEDWLRIPLEDITQKYQRHYDFIIVIHRCSYLFDKKLINNTWRIDVTCENNVINHVFP